MFYFLLLYPWKKYEIIVQIEGGYFGKATQLREGKLWIQTSYIL